MNPAFKAYVDLLEPQLRTLTAMAPVPYRGLPRKIPDRGIYLFSEAEKYLYVGRSNNIRRRLAGHCRPSTSPFSATFAFRIAREDSGILKPTYTPTGSRPDLVKDQVFGPAFVKAKARIAGMGIRFVEERDPVRQALLEIYVAVTHDLTRYDDFDNH